MSEKNPPKSFWSIVKSLGPGMILTGSIVGSGELIATTKVGAEAGFWLLWIIILGCVIKVFTQLEFGRYTVAHNEPTLSALNRVPGPRFKVNWVVWCWVIMTILIVSQLGGIVGGVGQALAMTKPLTEEGRQFNEAQNKLVDVKVQLALLKTRDKNHPDIPTVEKEIIKLSTNKLEEPYDAQIWAILIALFTSLMMWFGRYNFIKIFTTVLVVGFTFVTMVTLVLLQNTQWAVQGQDLTNGLSFSLPPVESSLTKAPLITALAAFGIIGVGSAELIFYPYWCMKQGYAKSVGINDGSKNWIVRAKGWMKIMYIDAWVAMVVYTLSTIAFYLLGAAVLGRSGLNPEKGDLIRNLSEMYVPVFGEWAPTLFLIGAVAVLFSTFFVACDGSSRVISDCFGLFGFHKNDEKDHSKWAKTISIIWPLLCLVVYLFINAPAKMVLMSGVAQSIMLPILGVSALFFRYKRCDKNLKPSAAFDFFLWLSVLAFALVGFYLLYDKLKMLYL